jgi:Flp pilus assembly protein TadG
MNVRKPRGVILLLTILLVIPFMLIMAGLAVDVASLVATRNELHRATDAAALAGAGKLAFDDTVFPAVRTNAVSFAAQNPARYGAVVLDPNVSNNPAGDVVLGIWNAGTFTPSVDGTVVNAVLCRTRQNTPTSFLRLIGLTTMGMSAQSVAVSNPPNSPPACVFPIGVTTCQFVGPQGYSSLGCGTAVTFATSSGNVPGTQAGTNTGAWVSLTGAGTPTSPDLRQAIADAANGTCSSNPVAGDTIGANNGMIQNVVDLFESYFIQQYNASLASPITIYGPKVGDQPGPMIYRGGGWEVYVPLIQTACPPQAINQSYTIQTFAKFVFTQVINHGTCVVNNPADTNSAPLCGLKDPSLRAIFGYFDCARLDSQPTSVPTPKAALATKLRLVQ